MSLKQARIQLDLKHLTMLREFFTQYAIVFEEYFNLYKDKKFEILIDDGVEFFDNFNKRLFSEVLGVQQYQSLIVNDAKDNFNVLNSSSDSSLSQLITDLEDSDLMDIGLNHQGGSLHNAVLNKTVGILKGNDLMYDSGNAFNFMGLRTDFPELYDALVWGHSQGFWRLDAELSHVGIGEMGNIDIDFFTIDEIEQLLDKPSVSGRIPPYDLFRGLMVKFSPANEISVELRPLFSWALSLSDEFKSEFLEDNIVNVIENISKELGGLPAGTVQGQVEISDSYGDSVVTPTKYKHFFANMLSLTDDQWSKLPDIDDDVLQEISKRMGITEDILHIDWSMINPGTADGFAVLYNEPELTGSATSSLVKNITMSKFFRFTENMIKHFKTQNVAFESAVSKGLPHLVSMYQRLGAMLLPEFNITNRKYTGFNTGDATMPVLMLPEYMDNKTIYKNVFRTSARTSMFQNKFYEITKEFSYMSGNKAVVLRPGTIITRRQESYLNTIAKQQNLEKITTNLIGKWNTGHAKSIMRARFGGEAGNYLVTRNALKKSDFLHVSGDIFDTPSPGFELTQFEYIGWSDYTQGKESIYTNFYKRMSLAMRGLGIEDDFLRGLIATIFDGQYYDNERRLLAIPIPSEEGFAFLNTSNMSADDMWNIIYMTSGNKNFTPDIFFGGKIGNVEYTEELRNDLKDTFMLGRTKKRMLELINRNITSIVSTPPVGVTGEGTPGPSSVYKLKDIINDSFETFEALYKNLSSDVFENLPDEIQKDLDKLVYQSGDMTPDEFAQLQEKVFQNLQGIELDIQPDTTSISGETRRTRTMLSRAGLRTRGRAVAGGPVPLADSNRNLWSTFLLPDLLTDTDRLGELSDGSIPTGENAILDAAYRVDGTASFFDLTQYSDYELDVTGLAAGRSHLPGQDINKAKTTIANLINSYPNTYGTIFSYKFLERSDGTTVIPFIKEDVKDIFKRNLLVSNRIISAGVNLGMPSSESNYARLLDRPNTNVVHFDVNPVTTNPNQYGGVQMLEFDIGIADNTNQDWMFRSYTQVAYSYDPDTGELRIHHWIDNLPNDSNERMGSMVRNQGNLPNHYATKDLAIIKSLMEIHDVVDENKVVDGPDFLSESVGVREYGGFNIDKIRVLPGRLAYAFGLVGTSDPDPDSTMYTKTMSESNAPLLRRRKLNSLLGVKDYLLGPIPDVMQDAEDFLIDQGTKLSPIINNPNFMFGNIEDKLLTGEDLDRFANDVRVEFEQFGRTQDNISGFNLSNVIFTVTNEEGISIDLKGSLNQDMVFHHIESKSSDTIDIESIGGILEDTIVNNNNLNDLGEISQDEINFLKNNYLIYPEYNIRTGKYEFTSLIDDADETTFKVTQVLLLDSQVAFYGDTETALDFNQVMKDNNFKFISQSRDEVHTYNSFVTEIMESNSYMDDGSGIDPTETGVRANRTYEYQRMHDLYMHQMYGPQKHYNGSDGPFAPFVSEKFYPLRKRYPSFVSDFTPDLDFIGGESKYTNGLLRHRNVTSTDIANVARKSGSFVKTIFKPVGGAFKLLEKFDIADKIVMKSIKPVSGAIAKGVSMTGGRAAIASLGGAAAAGTIGAGLAAVYAAAEIGALATGLVIEGDLFGDTKKLMKELRDDNPGDGAWKRFWVSTGKNAWKGLEWQQDHSLSGWVEKQIASGAGQAFTKIQEQRENNVNLVKEIANYTANNPDVFNTVNNYDPQYNDDFDNINRHMRLSQQHYGTEEYEKNLNKELNQITKYPVWQNSEELLYNGNEEFLATVDNYIKIAKAYESIGY